MAKLATVPWKDAVSGDVIDIEDQGNDQIRYLVAITAGDLKRGAFYMTRGAHSATLYCARKTWDNDAQPELAKSLVLTYRKTLPKKKKTPSKEKTS